MLDYAMLTDIDDDFYDVKVRKAKVEKNDYDTIVGDITGSMDKHYDYTPYPSLDYDSNELDKITKNIDLKYNNNNVSAEEDDHEVFMAHVLECPECRAELLMKLKQDYREDFSMTGNRSVDDQVFDIIIYVLTGIFVLFVLNLFLKLGKLIK